MTGTLVRDNDVVTGGAIAQLVLAGTGKPKEAMAVLHLAEEGVRDASRRQALFERVAGVLTLLEIGSRFNATHMLTEAAQLCAVIYPNLLKTNPDWACVVASLQAELELRVSGNPHHPGVRAALTMSEHVYAKLNGPSHEATVRHQCNLQIADDGTLPPTDPIALVMGLPSW